MRILFIGMSATGYIRDNWLIPMRQMYDVTYIPYDILMRAMGVPGLSEMILKESEKDYDYIFFYPDGRGQMFSDELFEKLRGKRTVVFHSDDVPEAWYRNSSRFDYRYDFIVSSCKEGYLRRVSPPNNWKNVCYVPWGYNPDIYFKTNEKKDTDIVFLGSNFFKDGYYYFDGKFRQEIMVRIYEESKKKGFSFKVYGPNWDKHPVIKECNGGFAEDDQINGILNRAKIILGLGYTMDENPRPHTKLKHFENAGTGSFQLVNKNDELEEIFGDSFGYFNDIEDMIDKINYYLTHEEEREEKARRAYDISISQCVMKQRIGELFEKANQFFNYHPDMEKHGFDFGEKYRICHKRIGEELTENDIAGHDYIHFLGDDIFMFDFNTTFLPALDSGKELPKALAFKSSVMFCDEDDLKPSVLIRRCAGSDVLVVPSKYVPDDLMYGKQIKKLLTCADYDDHIFPIENYLIRSDVAKEVREKFRNGSVHDLVDALDTNAICGDYIVLGTDFVKERYFKFFKKILEENEKVGVYGLLGYVFFIWEEWINSSGLKDKVVYLDRGRVGELIDDIVCIDPEEVLSGKTKLDVILDVAVFAGEEIYRFLDNVMKDTKVFKLYDMSVWDKDMEV